MQEEPQRSISFKELSWDTVDQHIKKTVFKDRSSFVEYCVNKEIHKQRLGGLKTFDIIIFLMMALTILVLLLLFIGS